jgi:hypothetical protein
MKAIFGLLVLTLVISCGGSKQNVGIPGIVLGGSDHEAKIQKFIEEYDVYEDSSSPSEAVKIDTEKGGLWVVIKHVYDGTSPFEGDRPGYVAYNMEGYEPGDMDNFINGSVDGFTDAVSSDVYPEDLYADEIVFVPSWDAFYSSGSSFSPGTYVPIEEGERNLWVFENTGSSNKDLEKMGSKVESIQTEGLQDALMYFGLSEEKSENMAKLAIAYNKITVKRSLNDWEKDRFSNALLGMSFNKATRTVVEEGKGALIDKAVKLHNISPEAVEEILNLL